LILPNVQAAVGGEINTKKRTANERCLHQTLHRQSAPPTNIETILVGGSGLLKTALRVMSAHRLKVEGIDDAEIVYTSTSRLEPSASRLSTFETSSAWNR